MTETEAPSDACLITVNGRCIDPHEHYAPNACGTDHIVLTLYDNITSDQHKIITDHEVQFQEDLGNFTYLCLYEHTSLEPLRALEWVRQVDVYRNRFKIPEELQNFVQRLKNSPQQNVDDDEVLINVMPHHGCDDNDGLQDLAIHVAAAAGVELRNVEVLTGKVQVQVRAGFIEKIAEDGYVRVIEEVVVPRLADDHANRVVLGAVGFPETQKYRGDNQVVSVIDTGFDLGLRDQCHPAFSGRIKELISLGRSEVVLPAGKEAEKYDDPDGHGTHVCGTIVGQRIATSEGLLGGLAPNAQLVVSSIVADDLKPSNIKDITEAFGIPYRKHGARIFSNSWGDSTSYGRQRQYATDAGLIDAFVRDHPDALIIFSAGNNNPDMSAVRGRGQPTPKPTIGSQAAAKNCLTVGASGTTRIAGRDQPSGLTSLQPDEIYPRSSRGRTKESRIKPDVVAPGFSIFSARSRHSKVKYTGFKVVKSDPDTGEIAWQTRSGTSHATPLVAGCAAILREIAERTSGESPLAALIKAVIINGADKLPKVDDEAQGFGRINLSASIEMLEGHPTLTSMSKAGCRAPISCGTLIGDAVKEGDVFEMTLDPDKQVQPTGSLELKITMVYNDIKGAEIQNNLNLSVIDTVTGIATYGYESEDDINVQNNVEQVVLPSPPANPLIVRVVAEKIFPEQAQSFVLAWALLKPYNGFKV